MALGIEFRLGNAFSTQLNTNTPPILKPEKFGSMMVTSIAVDRPGPRSTEDGYKVYRLSGSTFKLALIDDEKWFVITNVRVLGTFSSISRKMSCIGTVWSIASARSEDDQSSALVRTLIMRRVSSLISLKGIPVLLGLPCYSPVGFQSA